MHWKVCSQFESVIKNRPKFSKTFIDGSTNFKLTNLVDHAKSDIHKIAFSLHNKQQGQLPSTASNSKQQNQPKLEFNLNWIMELGIAEAVEMSQWMRSFTLC